MAPRLRPAWHILLYHDISYEETPYTRGIEGGTLPPDLLRDQVETLRRVGDLVGVDEGLRRTRSGEPLRRPMFSFWFDDGFAGVRQHALPILDEVGVSAAMSVCSRFVDRSELHWRLALSWLRHVDGLRHVRAALRDRLAGLPAGTPLRASTMDRFEPRIAQCILDLHQKMTTPAQREAAAALFDDRAGLRSLRDAGWLLCNHSAAHWPIGEAAAIDHFAAQFEECANDLSDLLTSDPDLWVLPFDRSRHRAASLLQEFAAAGSHDNRFLVLVGNRPTAREDLDRRTIYRTCAPAASGRALLRSLRATTRRRTPAESPAAPRVPRRALAPAETAAVRPPG